MVLCCGSGLGSSIKADNADSFGSRSNREVFSECQSNRYIDRVGVPQIAKRQDLAVWSYREQVRCIEFLLGLSAELRDRSDIKDQGLAALAGSSQRPTRSVSGLRKGAVAVPREVVEAWNQLKLPLPGKLINPNGNGNVVIWERAFLWRPSLLIDLDESGKKQIAPRLLGGWGHLELDTNLDLRCKVRGVGNRSESLSFRAVCRTSWAGP